MNQVQRQQAERAVKLMMEAGLDPIKGMKQEAVIYATQQWAVGAIDEVQLIRCYRNLTILSPDLRLNHP